MALPALAALGFVALARASAPSDEAEAAEERADWPAAFAAWQRCARETPDARRCVARAAELAPQAVDGFAGWSVLAAVRRDYRQLGSEAATARIRAAFDADPAGPAAPELATWLANEAAGRGDEAGAARWRGVATASPALPAPTRAWLEAGGEAAEARRRERTWTLGFSAAGAAALGLAATRGGRPLALGGAALAFVLLGGIPMVYAWAWGAELDVAGFGRMGLAAALAIAVAPRLPPWLAAPGAAACVLAVAGWNGWLGSMGVR